MRDAGDTVVHIRRSIIEHLEDTSGTDLEESTTDDRIPGQRPTAERIRRLARKLAAPAKLGSR